MLRFGYLVLMTAFVVMVWLNVVSTVGESGDSFTISRMGEAGKQVVSYIVWFQFLAAQLVTVLLLSTSISEEMYHGTMLPLLSTPLTSFQIIAGKLMGGLLQVLVLLGISFPLLAVVRVFGGVTAGYIIGSMCITIMAVLFAGAITMMYSILLKRTQVIILASLLTLVAWNGVVCLVLWMSVLGAPLGLFVCPAWTMWGFTEASLNPSSTATWVWFEIRWLKALWPMACAAMMGFVTLMLVFCSRAVRKVAMRRAIGEDIIDPMPPPPPPTAMPLDAASASALTRLAMVSAQHAFDSHRKAVVTPAQMAEAVYATVPPPVPAEALAAVPSPSLPGQAPPALPAEALIPLAPTIEPTDPKPIRRITGSPILWKELQKPLMPNRTARTVVLIVISVVVLMTYVFLAALGGMRSSGVQAFYLLLYLVPATFCTLLLSSTAITGEKETRCWPLLLTTTMTDGHVLWAKVAGVMRRSWPLWAPLVGHVLVNMLFMCLHPVALVHVLLMMVGTAAFALGLGLYVSTRLRRTTTAMVVTISLLVTVWGGVPLAAGMARSIVRDYLITSAEPEDDPGMRGRTAPRPLDSKLLAAMDGLAGSGPFVQAYVIADGIPDGGHELDRLEYGWPTGIRDAAETTATIALWAGIYLVLGLGLLWRARARFRRDIF